MSTVKICTYSRTFYPYIWGQKRSTIIGAYLVIEDGKIIKRGFRECYEYTAEDHAENEALTKGVEWVVANMDDLRDTNLQVFFCGAARNNMKKRADDGTFFSRDENGLKVLFGFGGNEKILKLFNKVTYHVASRIVINDGDDDDAEKTELFDMYAVVNKYFSVLYGNDINFGHTIIEDVEDEGIIKKIMVGMPEIRWRYGAPINEWT
jgi:hypothetical protein